MWFLKSFLNRILNQFSIWKFLCLFLLVVSIYQRGKPRLVRYLFGIVLRLAYVGIFVEKEVILPKGNLIISFLYSIRLVHILLLTFIVNPTLS